jgi:hypothetical protein
MDVLDIVLLALVYAAAIAGIAVATPRIGSYIASAIGRLKRGHTTTPAE